MCVCGWVGVNYRNLELQQKAIKVVDFIEKYWHFDTFRSSVHPEAYGMGKPVVERKRNFEPPEFILSVTGGAKDFDLPPEIPHESIKRSLQRVAQDTGCWIISGGSDLGVMKLLVGDVNKEMNYKIPCIGIMTWGVTCMHYAVVKETKNYLEMETNIWMYSPIVDSERRDWAGGNSTWTKINPGHTHFIFVDDGRNKFGVEGIYLCASTHPAGFVGCH